MNALKTINARVKVLAKKHPGSKRTTLQKQAGKEWRSGKLKKRRSSVAKTKRRSPVRKTKKRPSFITKTRVIYKVLRPKRRGVKPRIIVRRSRRVSGAGKSMLLPILAIGALVIGGYMLMKKRDQSPAIVTTNNPTRNADASNIIMYAQAAGATAAAIAQLINAINNSNDSQVKQMSDNVKSGVNPYANIAGY